MARQRVKRTTDVPQQWRNRIVDYGEMTAEELQANPNNPRIHDLPQRRAMTSMLDDLGWIAPIIVNRTTGLMVDGHMRVGEAAQRGPIPVAYVELSEDEERKALALMDPIGSMATYDRDILTSVLDGLATPVNVSDVLEGLIPGQADTGPKTQTVELKALQRAHVLVSIPLDVWDDVADLLDQIGEFDGVTVASTVN